MQVYLLRPGSYAEPINIEPHFGHVKEVHGVPRLCGTVYPHLGHLQKGGPPVPCLAPPRPLPKPLSIVIFVRLLLLDSCLRYFLAFWKLDPYNLTVEYSFAKHALFYP